MSKELFSGNSDRYIDFDIPPCIYHLPFFLVQYEPELFPGLIYRMKQPKIVLLIFVSGKIVITGAKVIHILCLLMDSSLNFYMPCWWFTKLSILYEFQVRDETYTAFENIYPVLTEFRKNQQWYGNRLFVCAQLLFWVIKY